MYWWWNVLTKSFTKEETEKEAVIDNEEKQEINQEKDEDSNVSRYSEYISFASKLEKDGFYSKPFSVEVKKWYLNNFYYGVLWKKIMLKKWLVLV